MAFQITILGAGAIGCALAAAWSGRGAHVRLYARPARAEALQNGVTIATAGRTEFTDARTLGLTSDRAVLAQTDLIVVTTKATAIPSVAETLTHTTAPVLSLLNGPRSAQMLARKLGREVLAGMVPWNAAWLAPELLLMSGAGAIAIPRDPALDPLTQIAQGSAAPVKSHADIDPVLWGKLLLNPVNALSGLPLKQMLSDRPWRLRYRAAYIEALSVLKTAGIRPAKVAPLPPGAIPHVLGAPDWLFERVFLPMQKLQDGATTSMAQDLAAGRETEIAFLNGAIVDLAREQGMEAPVNATLVAEIEAQQTR